MPEQVHPLTVREADREYNTLTNQIWTKYYQLDSGEFRAVGTPAFNVEACKLANLLACVSQLCQKLNLPTPKKLYKPSSIEEHFSGQICIVGRQSWLGYGVCSFVPITVLLSAP